MIAHILRRRRSARIATLFQSREIPLRWRGVDPLIGMSMRTRGGSRPGFESLAAPLPSADLRRGPHAAIESDPQSARTERFLPPCLAA